jgi:hypothetical protein
MMDFPGIKPMGDGDPINGADRHQCGRIDALGTQEETMGTLPNTRMLTLFRQSME